MSESPYAPPRAAVADVEPDEPLTERPWQVSRAALLLWIGLGINAANSAWTILRPPPQVAALGPIFMATMYAAGLLFATWVYRSLGKGRNWARIVVLIFAALAILGIPFVLFQSFRGASALLATSVALVGGGLKAYVAYLLLTAPAKVWFRGMKGRT